MEQGTEFKVSIVNLQQLQEALVNYPAISTPIIQNAVVAAQAIMAKFTNGSTVPIRTGYLVQNWAFEVGNLQARWYPKAQYAPYVEFGTAPARDPCGVNKRVLANVKTGEIYRHRRPSSRHEGESVHGTHRGRGTGPRSMHRYSVRRSTK